jgi:hypothetical protein
VKRLFAWLLGDLLGSRSGIVTMPPSRTSATNVFNASNLKGRRVPDCGHHTVFSHAEIALVGHRGRKFGRRLRDGTPQGRPVVRPWVGQSGLVQCREATCPVLDSAPGRIRTCDTRFRRAVLYPLSYEGLATADASLACRGRPQHQGHGWSSTTLVVTQVSGSPALVDPRIPPAGRHTAPDLDGPVSHLVVSGFELLNNSR